MKGLEKAIASVCKRLNKITAEKSGVEVTPSELQDIIKMSNPNLSMQEEVIKRLEKYGRILKRDGIYLIDPTLDEISLN